MLRPFLARRGGVLRDWPEVIDAEGKLIARTYGAQADVVARLFAAAPELLALVRMTAAQHVAPDAVCHRGITIASQCVRCAPILRAQALATQLEEFPHD